MSTVFCKNLKYFFEVTYGIRRTLENTKETSKTNTSSNSGKTRYFPTGIRFIGTWSQKTNSGKSCLNCTSFKCFR